MTRDEILAMPAGCEMDARISSSVFGVMPFRSDGKWDFTNERDYLDAGEPYYLGEHQEIIRLPEYSTDISAAWEVVEKIRAMEMDFSLTALSWSAAVRLQGGVWLASFESRNICADTAPLAICRAALLAVMGDK